MADIETISTAVRLAVSETVRKLKEEGFIHSKVPRASPSAGYDSITNVKSDKRVGNKIAEYRYFVDDNGNISLCKALPINRWWPN